MSEFRNEFYKELYYKEIERREQLSNRVNLPFSILTLIFGGLFYTVQNNNLIKIGWLHDIYYVLTVLSIGMLLANIGVLFRASFGYKYGYVPSAQLIKDHETALEDYYRTNSNLSEDKIKEAVDDDLKEYINGIYITTANNNAKKNDLKSGWLRIGSYGIIASITLLILTFVCFAPSFINKEEKVQKVVIERDKKSKENPVFDIELKNSEHLTDKDGKINIKISDLEKILERVEKDGSKQQ
ncbi:MULTISPECIES: hypothetical protein [Bacillus cereus group]|uniref:hypothetical protein n=1 Tax=Bacillus cereus group TaxID=86661 RepID=UPI000BEF6FBB|nr:MULTISPECIES: hypothetical protein [Bacillus cereus group]AVP46921.1 hypothetical protein C2I25_18540 [Bacillus cereus]PEL63762.1 hypothetical protein CN622_08770 [Bacillus wiedmannii]